MPESEGGRAESDEMPEESKRKVNKCEKEERLEPGSISAHSCEWKRLSAGGGVIQAYSVWEGTQGVYLALKTHISVQSLCSKDTSLCA